MTATRAGRGQSKLRKSPNRQPSTAVDATKTPWVDVELSGPSAMWTFRHLGSLTERYGMRIVTNGSPSTPAGGMRVAVEVPRARTRREAEEVVAGFLEWIRRLGDEIVLRRYTGVTAWGKPRRI